MENAVPTNEVCRRGYVGGQATETAEAKGPLSHGEERHRRRITCIMSMRCICRERKTSKKRIQRRVGGRVSDSILWGGTTFYGRPTNGITAWGERTAKSKFVLGGVKSKDSHQFISWSYCVNSKVAKSGPKNVDEDCLQRNQTALPLCQKSHVRNR